MGYLLYKRFKHLQEELLRQKEELREKTKKIKITDTKLQEKDEKLQEKDPHLIILDGNSMRKSISLGAGFSKKERATHNYRIAHPNPQLRA